jgi:TPR repeat protein
VNACCTGKGVEKNEVEAVEWLQKGVNGDNGQAMVMLSLCYEKGLGGVKIDPKNAARLLDLAVQRNERRAWRRWESIT